MEIFFQLQDLNNLDIKSNAIVDHSEYKTYLKTLNSEELESHFDTIFDDDLPEDIYSLKHL